MDRNKLAIILLLAIVPAGSQTFSNGNGPMSPLPVPVSFSSALTCTPSFSPGTGTYTSTQSVTISVAASCPAQEVIWYNTTGTFTGCTALACSGATQYTTPVSVATTETLYAIATTLGVPNSAIGSAAYTINVTVTYSKIPGAWYGVVPSKTTSQIWNPYAPVQENAATHECIPMPTGGTLQKFYGRLGSDPDSGASANGYTFTVEQTTVAACTSGWGSTALTFSILSSATPTFEGSYTGTGVHFAAGNYIDVVVAPSGTPANAPHMSWIMEFAADNSGETIILGGTVSASLPAATPRYVSLSGDGGYNISSTRNQNFTIFPMAGTITQFYFFLTTAPGTGGTRVTQLEQTTGGTTTSVGSAFTWSNSTNGLQSQSPSISVAAGDLFDISCTVTAGSPSASTAYWGLVFKPTTNGQFLFPVSAATVQLSTSANRYIPMAGSVGVTNIPNATETNVQNIFLTDFSLEGWTAWLDASPGSGTYTISLRENAGTPSTTYSTAMSTQGPTTSASTTFTPGANYNLYDTLIVPASTPTAARITISYIGFITPH